MKIFVYGTLRKGGRWHDYWLSDAIRIGDGTISGKLYQLANGLPAVVDVKRVPNRLQGEVYEISLSDAEQMDQFERGAGYEPIEGVPVVMLNSIVPMPVCLARVYEYQGSVATAERIVSGDYISHITRG